MKRFALAVGLLFVLALGVSLAAEAGAAKRPKVRVAKFTFAYVVDGTYSNDDNLGPNACNVEGHERADIALRVVYSHVHVRLSSGFVKDVRGADFSQGTWSDSGVRWYNPGGADCSVGVAPLQCSGAVKVGSLTDLYMLVSKGVIYFRGFTGAATQPMGEQGLESCGGSDPNWVLPYFGLSNALDPWRQGTTHSTLRALASLHKGHTLTLRVKHDPPGSSWDPANCNGGGVIGSAAGETCVGSLNITKTALTIRAE